MTNPQQPPEPTAESGDEHPPRAANQTQGAPLSGPSTGNTTASVSSTVPKVEAKAKKIRVAEAVETGVEGLLRFLQRYVSTAMLVAFWPRRGLRTLLADRRRELPRHVLPLTFLAIGVFLLSLLGQTAGVLVFDWIWFADDIGQKVTEALRKEVSLASVVVQAIPGMAGVLLLSAIFGLLARPWPLTRRLGLITYAYAIGAQALVLFLMVFGLVAIDGLGSKHLGKEYQDAGSYVALALLGIGLIGAFVGPTWFALRSLRPRRRVDGSGKLRTGLLLIWVLLSMLGGHVLVLYGARAPNELISAAKGSTLPSVNVTAVSYTVGKDKLQVEATFILENRDPRPLVWRTENPTFAMQIPTSGPDGKQCGPDWLGLTVVRVVNAEGRDAPLVQLDAARTTWVTVYAERDSTPKLVELLKANDDWAVQVKLQTTAGMAEIDCAPRTLVRRAASPSGVSGKK